MYLYMYTCTFFVFQYGDFSGIVSQVITSRQYAQTIVCTTISVITVLTDQWCQQCDTLCAITVIQDVNETDYGAQWNSVGA